MTSAPPIPGAPQFKYGKRAPDPANMAKALKFATYRAATVMPTFPTDDYLARVDWSKTMNGNDTFGDCVACWVVNTVNLISTILGDKPVVATLDEVIAFYKTQNPDFDPKGTSDTNGPESSSDNGMDMQTACEELVKNGIKIGGVVYKAAGFMKVDHTSLADIKAAISVGGSVGFGVQIADAQQSQFPGVWDYVAGSAIEGGHAITGGGHADVASDDVKAACWAAEFGTTDTFLGKQLDECWLVIWPWQLKSTEFIQSMDVATFAADVSAITGQPFPVSVAPEPVPTPEPAPAPVPAPAPAPVPDPPLPPVVVTPPTPKPEPTPDPTPEPVPAPGLDQATKTFVRKLKRWLDNQNWLPQDARLERAAADWFASSPLFDSIDAEPLDGTE